MATFSYEAATGARPPARRQPVEAAPRTFSYEDAVGPQPVGAAPAPPQPAAPPSEASMGEVISAAPGLAWEGFKKGLGGAITGMSQFPTSLPESFAEADAYRPREARAAAAKTAAEVAGVEDVARRAAFRMQGVPSDAGAKAATDFARQYAEDNLPGRAMTNQAQDAMAAQRGRLNLNPEGGKALGLDVLIALAQMAPGAAGTMLTRNPVPMMTSIGALAGGTKFADSSQDGRTPRQALGDASFFAAAEGLPEMIPGFAIAKRGAKFGARVLEVGLGEAGQNGISQIAEDFYDRNVIGKPISNKEMLANAARSALLGAIVGGGIGAVTAPFAGRARPDAPPAPPPMVDSNGLDGAAPDPLASVREVLNRFNVDPASVSSPEAAAAIAERLRANEARGGLSSGIRGGPDTSRMSPKKAMNATSKFIEEQKAAAAALEAGIFDGSIHPASMSTPSEGSTLPDDVTIIGAAEGNVRSDDAGAMAALDRQRAGEQYVLDEGAARTGDDPVLGSILADPSISRPMKIREVYNRLMQLPEVAAQRPGLRVNAPEAADIQGFYSGRTRPPPRNPDDPRSGPVQENFNGFEQTQQKPSPTQADLAAGRVYFNDATGGFTDQARGREPFTARTQTGGSDRAFPVTPDDPAGQPGFWEDRANRQFEEARVKAQADMEAKWESRRKADEDMARRTRERAEQAKARGEEFTGNPDADPQTRYRGKYSQKPVKGASNFWTTNPEGYVAGEDGTPVAFRSATEAAKWATKNGMAGDFEISIYGANTARVTLRRRPGSTYGQQPPPPSGPAAGRSTDTSQQGLPGPAPQAPPQAPPASAAPQATAPPIAPDAPPAPPPPSARTIKPPAGGKPALTMQAHIAKLARGFKAGARRFSFESAVDAGVDPDWLNSRSDLRRMFGKEKLSRGKDGIVRKNMRQINEKLKPFADLANAIQGKEWGVYGDGVDSYGQLTPEALADLINNDGPLHDPQTGAPYEQQAPAEDDSLDATRQAVRNEAGFNEMQFTDEEIDTIAQAVGPDGDIMQGMVDEVNAQIDEALVEARDDSDYDAGQEDFPYGPVTGNEAAADGSGVDGRTPAPVNPGEGQQSSEQSAQDQSGPAESGVGSQPTDGSLGLTAEQAPPRDGMTERQRAERDAGSQQSMSRRGNQQAADQQEGGMFDASRDQGDALPSLQGGALPDFQGGLQIDLARQFGNARDVLSEMTSSSDPDVAEMAKRLLPLIGDVKVEVLTNAEMNKLVAEKTTIKLPEDATVGGLYSNDDGSIALNGDMPRRFTMLHEAAHAATSDAITYMTPAGRRIIAIYDRFKRYDKGEYGFTNPHEFAAEVWSDPAFRARLRSLTDEGKVGNLWQRFVRAVSNVLGMKNVDFVEQVLQASEAGAAKQGGKSGGSYPSIERGPENSDPAEPAFWKKIASLAVNTDAIGRDLAGIRTAMGNPIEALAAVTQPMRDVVSAAFFSNDARARGLAAHFNAPSFTEYANKWTARAGVGDSTSRGYHEAFQQSANTRIGRAFDALEPFLADPASMSRIRDRLVQPNARQQMTQPEIDAARKIAAILKETLQYRRDAGETIGEVTDGYFPRVLDHETVINRREEFITKATKLYQERGVENPADAAKAWADHIFDTYAGLDGGLAFGNTSGAAGMGSSTAKAREFGKQADVLLKDFYQQDAFKTLAAYFSGSAKRAEQSRRFGKPGQEGSPERAAWVKKHGDITQLDELQDRIKAEILASGKDPKGALHELATIHSSNLNTLGGRNPRTRQIVSGLHAWNQFGKMSKVVITSLGELTMGVIRGGPKLGLPYVRDSIAETARLIANADKSDGYRWAESYGVITNAVVDQHLMSRAGSDENQTEWSQKALTNFYKSIGLYQFTTAERIAAATMHKELLRTFAGDLTTGSARSKKRASLYLREYGIADPQAFADRLLSEGPPSPADRAADKGFANEYATAIIRGVNQTVLNPNRAEKPSWASHPIGSLVFSLSGYSYAFKKNVLDRVGRLGVQAFKDRDPALLLPAMSLALMAFAQDGIDSYLKPFLYGSNYDFDNEDSMTHMLRIVDRAGFTGALSPFVNAIKGVRYDRSLLESMAGPIVGSIGNAGQRGIELMVKNSPETNTAERNAAAALYDTVVAPAASAIAATRLTSLVGTPVIITAGNKGAGALPGSKDKFVDFIAGQKEE